MDRSSYQKKQACKPDSVPVLSAQALIIYLVSASRRRSCGLPTPAPGGLTRWTETSSFISGAYLTFQPVRFTMRRMSPPGR